MMMLPTYLKAFAESVVQTDYVEIALQSTAQNKLFELYYSGELYNLPDQSAPYIVSADDTPAKIVAKDVATGEDILLFDVVMMECFVTNTIRPWSKRVNW